jgi:hypothetical protein
MGAGLKEFYVGTNKHKGLPKTVFEIVILLFGVTGASQCSDYAMGWMIRGLNTSREKENFLFFRMSRPALEPTHPPIQWVWGFMGVKWPGRDVTSTYMHLVPRLRMSGAVVLHLYAFMVWTGTTVPFYLLPFLLV